MGKFMYETLRVDFEDRVLAHLQYVIGAKLRRRESFHFSWRDDASIGSPFRLARYTPPFP